MGENCFDRSAIRQFDGVLGVADDFFQPAEEKHLNTRACVKGWSPENCNPPDERGAIACAVSANPRGYDSSLANFARKKPFREFSTP